MRPFLIRRGNWTPLLPVAVRLLVVMLPPLETFFRGLDYITGDQPGTTSSLTFVEQALPLWGWGLLCLVSSVLILAGFAGRWPNPAIIGFAIGGSTYLSLAYGLALKTLERGGDGFRTPTMFVVFGLVFWGMAWGYYLQVRADEKEREHDGDA